MIIREQCLPGQHNCFNHSPTQLWPDDCTVQWGGEGFVLKSNGNYRTAFFEAFPENPSTFIRGEGKTIVEAELIAWKQFQKIIACTNHEFERRAYKNGVGFCKHCNLFNADAFLPSTLCCKCNQPTYWTNDKDGNFWCETCAENMPYEMRSETWKMLHEDEDMPEPTEEDFKQILDNISKILHK